MAQGSISWTKRVSPKGGAGGGRGINGDGPMGGDVTWSGEHTVQCTDDVLWNFVNVTPKNSIKRKTKPKTDLWEPEEVDNQVRGKSIH